MRHGKATKVTPAYRREIASRSLAAIFGGLAVAGAAGWLIQCVLVATGTQPKAVAVVSGTYFTWIVWSGAAMWAFHSRTQAAAWGWLLVPAVPVGLYALVAGGG